MQFVIIYEYLLLCIIRYIYIFNVCAYKILSCVFVLIYPFHIFIKKVCKFHLHSDMSVFVVLVANSQRHVFMLILLMLIDWPTDWLKVWMGRQMDYLTDRQKQGQNGLELNWISISKGPFTDLFKGLLQVTTIHTSMTCLIKMYNTKILKIVYPTAIKKVHKFY